MIRKIGSLVKKIAWFIWLYIVYMIVSIPTILSTTKKFNNNWWLNIVYIIIGSILSIVFIRYLWKKFDGYRPEVTFIRSWTKKQRIGIYISLLITLVVGEYLLPFVLSTSDNQNTIEKMFQVNRVSIVLSAVIFGPIIEELIYRGVFQKLFFQKIRTNWQFIVYVLLSAMIFTAIHGDSFSLDLLPYTFMGIIFATGYVLLRDIKYSISFHIINNIIAMISLFLIYK